MFTSNISLRFVFVFSFLPNATVFAADSSKLKEREPVSFGNQKEECLSDVNPHTFPLDRELNRQLEQRYDLALAAAPPGVQRVIRVLENPQERDVYDNSCLALVGKEGTGKTTIAEAIAYRANYHLETITSRDVEVDGRAATSIEISNQLEKIECSGRKTVIFFDEFNILVRNHNDKHHDTDRNATNFIGYFAKIEKERNYNVFCILAMNRFSDLPKNMRQRLRDVTFEITDLTDPVQIRNCFDICLRNDRLIINPEEKKYLMQRLEGFNFSNPRDIKKIINRIINTSFVRRERPVVMTREDIDEGIRYDQIFLKLEEDGKDDVCDEERRFRETLRVNEEHFQEQMRITKEHFQKQLQISKVQLQISQEQFKRTGQREFFQDLQGLFG